MKQEKRAIVIADISSGRVKALVSFINGQNLQEKLLLEIQGVTEELKGISKKGVVHNQEQLETSLQKTRDTIDSSTGYDIRKIRLLYAHNNIRFLKKKTGISVRDSEMHITEDWIETQKKKMRRKLERSFPHETCTHLEIQSLVADNEDITHNPYEYTTTSSLVITYGIVMTPKTFTEHIRESAEKISQVTAVKPTAVSNTFFLSDAQKDFGALVLEIGAHFTTITACRDGLITDIQTAPFGIHTIIQEIVLQKQISIEEGERLFYDNHDRNETLSTREKQAIGRKITGHIKTTILPVIQKMGSLEDFSGGVVLVGDGAHFPGMEESIRKTLKLYTTHAAMEHRVQSKRSIPPSTWECAYGFLRMSAEQEMNALLTMQRGGSLWQRFNRFLDRFSRGIQ